LLTVKDDDFAIVRSCEGVEIRGVGLHVKGIESLSCGDVGYSEIGVIEAWVIVNNIAEPILCSFRL
jgi:hypothetical protein